MSFSAIRSTPSLDTVNKLLWALSIPRALCHVVAIPESIENAVPILRQGGFHILVLVLVEWRSGLTQTPRGTADPESTERRQVVAEMMENT
jgi:hypothetical protein